MLEVDIDKNDETIDEKAWELNRIEKAIHRRRQKDPENLELSFRVNEVKNLKTEVRNETR